MRICQAKDLVYELYRNKYTNPERFSTNRCIEIVNHLYGNFTDKQRAAYIKHYLKNCICTVQLGEWGNPGIVQVYQKDSTVLIIMKIGRSGLVFDALLIIELDQEGKIKVDPTIIGTTEFIHSIIPMLAT